MSIFRYYFDIAFPWEYQYERRQPKSGWVTQGIRMSSKRMRHLNSLSKQQNLTEHMKLYIARYKTLYRKVIREAKRRENDHYILQAHNKSKATWRIIHKETGRASPQGQDIILVKNNEEVTNPGRVAKLLEKLMYNRLTEFMDRNEILTEEQHGFRTKKSTDTALQSFTKRVQEAIDKKMNPIGIFLDLTKAYDVLSHKVLLSKLDTYSIRGVANKWFESYLSLRKQRVEINSKKHRTVVTATRDIMNGVPQGSTLGPHIIPAIHK